MQQSPQGVIVTDPVAYGRPTGGQAYLDEINGFCEEIRKGCVKQMIDYVRISTDQDLEVQDFLVDDRPGVAVEPVDLVIALVDVPEPVRGSLQSVGLRAGALEKAFNFGDFDQVCYSCGP